MKKKQIIDLIVAIFLIICGTIILIFPLLNIVNIKWILGAVFIFYGVMNMIQFLTTKESKDYEGLFTAIASLISLVVMLFIVDVQSKPWNLALVLFIWIILMSLIKLKKCDYYNDRKNIMWIQRIITLVIFIITGIIVTINLYYKENVQVLIVGFFFYIHGILELTDPLTIYLTEKK